MTLLHIIDLEQSRHGIEGLDSNQIEVLRDCKHEVKQKFV